MRTKTLKNTMGMQRNSTCFTVFILCLVSALNAQISDSLEKKLNSTVPNCYDVGYNSLRIIPDFYRHHKMDSLTYVFDYLVTTCGNNYYTDFLGILLSIDEGNFKQSDYPDLASILIDYRTREERVYAEEQSGNGRYMNYAMVVDQYFIFLRKYAFDLKSQVAMETIENDIVQYMSGDYDELMAQLSTGQYPDNAMQEGYDSTKQALVDMSEFAVGIIAGVWVPTSNLNKTIGLHPEIGLSVGYMNNGHYLDFGLTSRLLRAENEYRVKQDDSIYTTDDFVGFHLAASYGRSLYRDLKQDLMLRAGMAYEGMTAVKSDGGDQEVVEPTTFNANVGMAYRWYFKNFSFLECDVRYHFLTYENGIDNSFDGDAITLRLIVGMAYYDKPKGDMIRAMKLR